jgi:hypothetical protein
VRERKTRERRLHHIKICSRQWQWQCTLSLLLLFITLLLSSLFTSCTQGIPSSYFAPFEGLEDTTSSTDVTQTPSKRFFTTEKDRKQ